MARTNTQTKMVVQLDELLTELRQLQARAEHDDLSDLPQESRVLATRLQAALDRLTTPGDTYGRAAEQCRNQPTHIRVFELAGIAEALSDDLSSGWLETVSEMLHSETFAEILDM